MTRDDWNRFERIQHTPDVLLAMRARCEEQGHEFTPGLDAMFRLSTTCKWCGGKQ